MADAARGSGGGADAVGDPADAATVSLRSQRPASKAPASGAGDEAASGAGTSDATAHAEQDSHDDSQTRAATPVGSIASETEAAFAEVMLAEEAERTAGFALVAAFVSAGVISYLPFLGGDPFAKRLCGIALAVNLGDYATEIIRAGIQAIHKGQVMAARGLGMSYAMAMRRVILPQAARKMTPELISNFVQVLKGTAIVSVLGFPELMYYANLVNSFAFRSVEVYTTAAIIYFALGFPISMWARRYEKTLLRTEA